MPTNTSPSDVFRTTGKAWNLVLRNTSVAVSRLSVWRKLTRQNSCIRRRSALRRTSRKQMTGP